MPKTHTIDAYITELENSVARLKGTQVTSKTLAELFIKLTKTYKDWCTKIRKAGKESSPRFLTITNDPFFLGSHENSYSNLLKKAEAFINPPKVEIPGTPAASTIMRSSSSASASHATDSATMTKLTRTEVVKLPVRTDEEDQAYRDVNDKLQMLRLSVDNSIYFSELYKEINHALSKVNSADIPQIKEKLAQLKIQAEEAHRQKNSGVPTNLGCNNLESSYPNGLGSSSLYPSLKTHKKNFNTLLSVFKEKTAYLVLRGQEYLTENGRESHQPNPMYRPNYEAVSKETITFYNSITRAFNSFFSSPTQPTTEEFNAFRAQIQTIVDDANKVFSQHRTVWGKYFQPVIYGIFEIMKAMILTFWYKKPEVLNPTRAQKELRFFHQKIESAIDKMKIDFSKPEDQRGSKDQQEIVQPRAAS